MRVFSVPQSIRLKSVGLINCPVRCVLITIRAVAGIVTRRRIHIHDLVGVTVCEEQQQIWESGRVQLRYRRYSSRLLRVGRCAFAVKVVQKRTET